MQKMHETGFDPWVGKIPWSRKWQPTPVVFAGEFHGERSLVGYSPRGCRESDMTEHACTRDPDTVASLWGLVYRSSHQLFWSLPQQQLENRSVYSINSCFPTGVWKWVGLFILGKQCLRGPWSTVFKYLKGCLREEELDLFPGIPRERQTQEQVYWGEWGGRSHWLMLQTRR